MAREYHRCADPPEGCGRTKEIHLFRHNPVSGTKRLCKACEQRQRYAAKEHDPVGSMIQSRAERKAKELRDRGYEWVTTHTVLCGNVTCDRCKGKNLAWSRLVPVITAMIGSPCLSCGSTIAPSGFIDGDLSRLTFDHKIALANGEHAIWKEHARNIDVLDFSCNREKHQKTPEQWLVDQWDHQESEYLAMTLPLSQRPQWVADPIF